MSLPADNEIVVEVSRAHGAAGIGRVIGAGEHGAALLGKRVLVGPIDPCGECEVCRRGGAPVCPLAKRRDTIGAQVTVAARWVVALDDALPLDDELGAHVAGAIVLAYTLYARSNLAPRDPVVVIGAAGDLVARYLVQIHVAKGITPTVVIDPDDARDTALADLALARGAALARIGAHASDADARATVGATFAAQQIGNRPWRVLATAPTATPRAAALCGPRATLTVRAGGPDLPADLAAREVTIFTVAAAHPDLVVEVAAMCAKGEIVG